jgi:hypothetical protein
VTGLKAAIRLAANSQETSRPPGNGQAAAPPVARRAGNGARRRFMGRRGPARPWGDQKQSLDFRFKFMLDSSINSQGDAKMGRQADPQARYRIRIHNTKGYNYASTQPPSVDPKTGKRVYRYTHWGTVDEDLKFIPNDTYLLAPPEERAKLIFPGDWDLSEANKLIRPSKPARPSHAEGHHRLYGDIWLLEQAASATGIRRDLEAVFDLSPDFADDILTLAMFSYLTEFDHSRVAGWQEIVKAPSSRDLTPSVIDSLTQSITDWHRKDLFRLRAARVANDEFFAVDSTSRSARGDGPADMPWGQNKDLSPQTTDLVVYSLSSHAPVYYKTFPGNLPDSRAIDLITEDLNHTNFKNYILITDRGFETIYNLEKPILRGKSIITCANTSQKHVADAINSLGKFSDKPDSMKIDPKARHYYKQIDIDYQVERVRGDFSNTKQLKLNLYLDPVRRAIEIMVLDELICLQQESLDEMLSNIEVVPDDAAMERGYGYFKLLRDPATGALQGYQRDEERIEAVPRRSGFYSIITHQLDFDARKTFQDYSLRDEQETRLQRMKSRMTPGRPPSWRAGGEAGLLLIMFVSLVLGSHVRHVWSSTRLHDLFQSPMDVVDAMRPIRWVEHPKKGETITTFNKTQRDICEAFGLRIP